MRGSAGRIRRASGLGDHYRPACQQTFANSFFGIQRGRSETGARTATGRPSTVMTTCSPASTRRGCHCAARAMPLRPCGNGSVCATDQEYARGRSHEYRLPPVRTRTWSQKRANPGTNVGWQVPREVSVQDPTDGSRLPHVRIRSSRASGKVRCAASSWTLRRYGSMSLLCPDHERRQPHAKQGVGQRHIGGVVVTRECRLSAADMSSRGAQAPSRRRARVSRWEPSQSRHDGGAG